MTDTNTRAQSGTADGTQPGVEHTLAYAYPSSNFAEQIGFGKTGGFTLELGGGKLVGFGTFAEAIDFIRKGQSTPSTWSMDHPNHRHRLSEAQRALLTPTTPVAQGTVVALIERCIKLGESNTPLDYLDEVADLLGHLPDILKAITLSTQVTAAMESMLLSFGSKMPAADRASRTENSDALAELLKKMGA
ncbi:hypothetical protein [Comamonas thiooxydans]|uniref:hypothetical protein n=1 Tax=Comamonas thiooxydans TaxID=363952 RepID=UPI000B41B139|nr:hypothetical protein [Comamonas thiooxydans]